MKGRLNFWKRLAICFAVQEPCKYNWGTEAFLADPNGYVWALVNSPK
jgi:hypothetical protein